MLNFISPITNFISKIFNKISNIVLIAIKNVVSIVGNYVRLFFDMFTMLFKMIGGAAKIISGAFTFDTDKMKDGLAQIFEAISNMAIKVYEFIAEIFAKQLPSILIKAFFGVFSWVAEQIGKLFGWIPKIGDDIKKKMHEVSIGSKDLGNRLSEGIKTNIDESVNFLKDKVEVVGELMRGKEQENVKARAVIDKNRESQNKFKKTIEDKNKQEQDIKKQNMYNTQIIKNLDTSIKDNTNSNKEIANKLDRPNVTNNTYVEYRAAEDDEVNRRMIERVMNDILKADIGLMMGDTAGFGANE